MDTGCELWLFLMSAVRTKRTAAPIPPSARSDRPGTLRLRDPLQPVSEIWLLAPGWILEGGGRGLLDKPKRGLSLESTIVDGLDLLSLSPQPLTYTDFSSHTNNETN